MRSIKPFLNKNKGHVFEYIYFARPDSLINGNVHMNTEKLGIQLAKEADVHADVVASARLEFHSFRLFEQSNKSFN